MASIPRLARFAALIGLIMSSGACGGSEPQTLTCRAAEDCIYSDQNIAIVIPAAAIPNGLALTATAFPNPPDSATIVPGTTYEIEPTGTVFSPRATITIAVPPESLALAAGVQANELGLYKRVGSTWSRVDSQVVNIDLMTIQARLAGLSLYTVMGAPAFSLTIAPSPTSVGVAAQAQLFATVKDSSGNVLEVRPVQWSSSNTAVATVNASGKVTGVAVGSATITGQSGNAQGTASVNVTAGGGTPASVTVGPTPLTVAVNTTGQLTAVVKDANNAVIANASVTWASQTPGIATVDATGKVTAHAIGLDTVTATAGAAVGKAVINVPSSVTPVFADDFEPTASADQNGYGWRGGVRAISTAVAHSGTHAMSFSYTGNAIPGQSDAEQRLQFGSVLGEFWLEYWLFIPANYTHRNNSTSDNNKFLGIFWRAPPASASGSAVLDQASGAYLGYGSGHGSYILDLETEIQTPATPILGDSRLAAKNTTRGNNGGAGNIVEFASTAVNPLISDAGPMARNAWSRVRIHVKASSSPTASDGSMELWINNVIVLARVNQDYWYPTKAATASSGTVDATHPAVANPFFTDPMGWNWMYFMGYSNSGYTATTVFYVDEVKIYNANPGW